LIVYYCVKNGKKNMDRIFQIVRENGWHKRRLLGQMTDFKLYNRVFLKTYYLYRYQENRMLSC